MSKRKKSKVSPFKGKIRQNIEDKRQESNSFGYLKLPANLAVWKAPAGHRVKFDIIPYEIFENTHPDKNEKEEFAIPGTLWYKRPFKIHRNIGADNETVVCPTSFGKKCPICDFKKKRRAEGVPWDADEMKALNASNRVLYYIKPNGQKDYEEIPHVWEMAHSLFQKYLQTEIDEDEELEIFPDLDSGYTLNVRFNEETFGKNTYAETGRIDFDKRKEPLDESILDDLPDLGNLLKLLTYSELEKLFLGAEDDDVVEEEEPEEEKTTRMPRRRKTTTPEEEEPEEEEPEEEEPEEEEYTKGSIIIWEYRKKELTGRVTEVLSNGLRAEREDNGRITLVPFDKILRVEPEKLPKGKQSTKRQVSKKSKNTCPHGHTFGIDIDGFEECEDCELYDACEEQFEKGEK